MKDKKANHPLLIDLIGTMDQFSEKSCNNVYNTGAVKYTLYFASPPI